MICDLVERDTYRLGSSLAKTVKEMMLNFENEIRASDFYFISSSLIILTTICRDVNIHMNVLVRSKFLVLTRFLTR